MASYVSELHQTLQMGVINSPSIQLIDKTIYIPNLASDPTGQKQHDGKSTSNQDKCLIWKVTKYLQYNADERMRILLVISKTAIALFIYKMF